jgi:DNA-directed RNA polymerase subunit L
MGASGLDLSVVILNPLVYWLARRAQLDIMVYTIDHPLLARYVRLFYPGVHVCTNLPANFTAEPAPRPDHFRTAVRHLARRLRRLITAEFIVPDDYRHQP